MLPQESWSEEAAFPPARSQKAKVKVRALSWVLGLSSGPGMSGAYVGALVFSLLTPWLLLIMGSAIREKEERAGYDRVKQRPNPSLGSLWRGKPELPGQGLEPKH